MLLANGIALLFVNKVECYLSICQLNPPPVENFLSRFVFKYRNQPHEMEVLLYMGDKSVFMFDCQ